MLLENKWKTNEIISIFVPQVCSLQIKMRQKEQIGHIDFSCEKCVLVGGKVLVTVWNVSYQTKAALQLDDTCLAFHL